jgi:hypothetical protein
MHSKCNENGQKPSSDPYFFFFFCYIICCVSLENSLYCLLPLFLLVLGRNQHRISGNIHDLTNPDPFVHLPWLCSNHDKNFLERGQWLSGWFDLTVAFHSFNNLIYISFLACLREANNLYFQINLDYYFHFNFNVFLLCLSLH